MEKDKCILLIEDLFQKYKDDEYMTQRLNTRILNYLTNELAGDERRHERQTNRALYLNAEKNVFVQVFLSENKYYYLASNNSFFYYNGKSYSIVKEDDIILKLLSSISNQGSILMEWKHKTKKQIIGRIKERSIFNSIPETETIQNVLNVLYPCIFNTKAEAKYFLTVLGDNILKKNNNLIFLVSSAMKQFLQEIDKITTICFGSVNTQNFLTKYHENHTYANCRLLRIIDNFSFDIWRSIILENGLNLICVATHYSNRYGCSDRFLDIKADEELKSYAFYLKNNTQLDIVSGFCNKCITASESATAVEWKNLHFIWKQYLSELKVPNVIFSNTLKQILREKYEFSEDHDAFLHITSRYLPLERLFIQFWETHMILDDENEGHEMEIEEVCALFKSLHRNFSPTEEYVCKIVKHFFPSVEIIDSKYILRYTCNIWNKRADILASFPFIVTKLDPELPFISLDEVYEHYSVFCRDHNKRFIASKNYVEKYLCLKAADYFIYNKCLKKEVFVDLLSVAL
jgi:hypothetical protein